MKFEDLKHGEELTPCPSVNGVCMRNISFSQAEEYEELVEKLSEDLKSEDKAAVRKSMTLILWLFQNVLRGEDGSEFDDIKTEKDCWDKVPVKVSRLLFKDVTDVILGGSDSGN